MKNEISNDELARIIANGFAGTATKDDIKELKSDLDVVKKDIGDIAKHIRLIEDSFAMPKERRLKLSRSRL